MSTKHNTAFCDECVHHRPTALTPAQVCRLGHRPRFFIPYTMRDIMRQDYGWKRRCADFSHADRNPDVGNL